MSYCAALFHRLRICYKRYILSRMVCACIRRVISMVCRDDEQIIMSHFIYQHTQIFIKLFDFLSISLWISSRSPKCVKIYKIYKTQSIILYISLFTSLLIFCISYPLQNHPQMPHPQHFSSEVAVHHRLSHKFSV